MRVGLVLGAGGVLGASWLIGALEALEAETGWRARTPSTSSARRPGRSSVPSRPRASRRSNERLRGRPSLDGFADAEARADAISARLLGTEYRLHRALPPIGPGSWRLALSTLRIRAATRRRAVRRRLAAARLHLDRSPSRPGRELVRGGWPDHPGYWAVAADYGPAARRLRQRRGAARRALPKRSPPRARSPASTTRSRSAGRRYVDGGICSTSNLDLLAGHDLDLVVCLNPMSSVHRSSAARRPTASPRYARGGRPPPGPRGTQAARAGTEVLILQPGAEDCALMGAEPDERRAARGGHGAGAASVARELRACAGASCDVTLRAAAPARAAPGNGRAPRWARRSSRPRRPARW